MVTSTANVNKVLETLSMAISAGNRAGMNIGCSFQQNYFCVFCLSHHINRTIDLEEIDAKLKLKALLNDLYAIVPAEQASIGAH